LFDSLDDEPFVLGFYLPYGVGVEAIFVEGDLTRRQRAGKSAEQSSASRRDQIVEG
jgi:hypothetical protein